MIRLLPSANLVDDAGQRRRVISVRALHGDARRSNPTFASLIHRTTRVRLAVGGDAATVSLVIIAIFGALFTHLIFFSAGPTLVPYLLWSVLACVFAWCIQLGHRPEAARRVAKLLLADGICPSCAYNLGGLPDRNDLVECPECGARWRATRIAHRHEFVAAPESEVAALGRWWRRLDYFDRGGPKRINDDAGRVKAVVPSHLLQPIHSATGDRRTLLREARREIRRHSRWRRLTLACLVLAVLGIFAWSIVVPQSPMARPSAMRGVVGTGVAAFGVLLASSLMYGASGITSSHIRRALLRRRLCPSCSADLGDKPERTGDGLTTCHDCGAAWRLEA